jgi:hypothetical protein
MKVLINAEDPMEPIVRGAADRVRKLRRPFRIGVCMSEELTDEQYETGLKHWEAIEKERIERGEGERKH